MFEYLSHIIDKISLFHLNALFLLGLALFGGTVGGRLFQRLRIPQVVGYILIGIIIGQSGLRIVGKDVIQSLQPFSYFALGLIGFMIGGELKKGVFSKYGKHFIYILLSEGITAFLAVTVLVGVVGTFILKDVRLSWALALLLGAIASATAPAATTEVLREYKARGPLTTTILGIIAMDDALALLLFAVASSIAGSLIGQTNGGLMRIFTHPVYEIGGSVFIGVLSGLLLSKMLRRYTEERGMLAFCIGAILLVSGFSLAIKVDMLLAVMTLGAIIVNFIPKKSEEVFKLVSGFTPPIYVLFFVLVGAKLQMSHMTPPVIVLALVYVIARSFGKMFGARFGAKLSNASKTVRENLSLCLFSQAGVAIGLSILTAQYFPGEIGNIVVVIITATAFILEIIGPPFVKVGITRAKEVGLNITEEDLLRTTRTKDIVDRDPPYIYDNTPLDKILKLFSDTNNLYYPVVDNRKKVVGVLGVDSIKKTFMETGLVGLVLAADLMDPVVATVSGDSMLSEAKEVLGRFNLEYLLVISEENKIVGFTERRVLNKLISTKLVKLQQRAESAQE